MSEWGKGQGETPDSVGWGEVATVQHSALSEVRAVQDAHLRCLDHTLTDAVSSLHNAGARQLDIE